MCRWSHMVTVNYLSCYILNNVTQYSFTIILVLWYCCVSQYGQVQGIALSLSFPLLLLSLCVLFLVVVIVILNLFLLPVSPSFILLLSLPPSPSLSSSLPLPLSLCRILLSVEKNTVKIKEHGKEVLFLEKSTGGK